MPGYIKMYYACAIYFLLWTVGVGIWLTYNILRYHARDSESLLATSIAYFILVITFVKGVVSIKAWQCYRQAIQLTRPTRTLFIIMYYLIMLLGLGMLLLVIFVIPDDLRRNYTYGSILSPTIVLLDSSIVLLTLACIYFAITDRLLLKAINKKLEENLLSFEMGE